MIEIKNLSKKYKEKEAVKDITFRINDGEIVALLGKNGAGKTTIMNSIAGNIFPTTGDILFDNVSIIDGADHRTRFGILIDANFFDYLNVNENLYLLLKAQGIVDKQKACVLINQILKKVGLYDQKYKKVKSFSFGMKQRLGLAQALITDINFLMLDEPFVGLDPIGKELFKDVIKTMAKDKHIPVLFSSHDLADVEDICDRVVMIQDGVVIYNDIYNKYKKYTFVFDDIIPLNKELQEEVNNGRLLIKDNAITFSDTHFFELIKEGSMFGQLKLKDISVDENSLLQLFEG